MNVCLCSREFWKLYSELAWVSKSPFSMWHQVIKVFPVPFVWTLNAWKTFPGKKHNWKNKTKKDQVICVVATFRSSSGKKKKKEGRKQTQRFCLENAALAEAARRSRMQLPWYFIYELIYGFWTAFNDPPLSLWVWALGSIKAAQCVKLGALEVSGKPPQHNLWSH